MKLIKRYLSLHLKKSLEYKSSFILTSISQAIYMIAELYAVYALFIKFNLLDTFNKYELLLGFSTVWLGYSICELFGRGFDEFSKIIVNGKFDILLIRPRSIYMQVFGEEICYEKSSRVLMSLFIYIYSASKVITNLTILKVLLLILMVLGCVVIIISLFILAASVCFKTIQGIEIINILTNGSKQVSEYPIGIYRKPIRLFFTIIIPIALVNYYPIDYLSGRTTNIIYLLYPCFTFILFLVSTLIFKLGVKKYCSTGS